jgi:hypothetical protein
VDYLANIVQAQVGPVQSLWETQGTTGTSIAKGGCSTTSEFRGMGMSVAFFLILAIGNSFQEGERAGKAEGYVSSSYWRSFFRRSYVLAYVHMV